MRCTLPQSLQPTSGTGKTRRCATLRSHTPAEKLTDRRVAYTRSMTAGADGASWVDQSGTVSVPAPPAKCVDSTGARDAFDAGLLAAWLRGASPREALLTGVELGTTAVQQVGAQPSITG